MTKAEIIAAIKEIDGYTSMEGKAIVDMAQMALLNKLYDALYGAGSASTPVSVNLVTSLSSDYDTIDINKMSKGAVTTAHSAITATATSTEIDCTGYNTISVECTISGMGTGSTWQIDVIGCAVSGGTFLVVYDDAHTLMQVSEMGTSQTHTFRGVPNYTEITATLSGTGTITIKVTPFNL